jgi:hypothetical protein
MTPEEYIEVICPQLFVSEGLATYVTMASGMSSLAFFGDQWALAVALLAAHYWYLAESRRGQAGVETYKMEGRLATSTGGVGVLRDSLDLSNYGMQYKTLRQGRMAGIAISDSNIMSLYGGL